MRDFTESNITIPEDIFLKFHIDVDPSEEIGGKLNTTICTRNNKYEMYFEVSETTSSSSYPSVLFEFEDIYIKNGDKKGVIYSGESVKNEDNIESLKKLFEEVLPQYIDNQEIFDFFAMNLENIIENSVKEEFYNYYKEDNEDKEED